MPETIRWYFAPFHLDLEEARLWRGTEPVRLTAKALAVLGYLVEHAGQLVTKDDLFAAAWSATYVSEATLSVCIGEIRRALGDAAQTPQYVETVRGRGYRFVAPVTAPPLPSEPAVIERSQTPWHTQQGIFVGREAALTELHQRWAQAQQGVRQVVLVTGEAGIGKTALVDTFVAQVAATGMAWHSWGQCIEQHGMGEAYLPLLEALGRLGRAPGGSRLLTLLHQQAPSWLLHLPALLPPESFDTLQRRAGSTTRERMLRELAEVIEVLTVEQPLILVLEDLHWSDGATLDWLASVARRREAARLLVLGTYRPVDAIVRRHPIHALTQDLRLHGQATEVILGYWPVAEVATYLAQRFGDNALPAALSGMLHQRTDGNPLFLVTVVNDLVQHGVLRHEPTGWTLVGELEAAMRGIPENLQQFMEQQLAQLSAAEQVLLEAASVAGMEFAAAAVAAAVAETVDTVERQCTALARRGQFVQAHDSLDWPDGTVTARYGFHHALYREFLYDRLPPGQRLRWHRQIGLRLETAYGPQAREVATELAAHFVRGHDPERAVQYLGAAGERALQRSAQQEAIAHLTQGLTLLAQVPDTLQRAQQELRLYTALGPALMIAKGYAHPDVERAYTRARELCQQVGDTPQLFPVLLGLVAFYRVRAQYEIAWELTEQALHLAEHQGNPALLVEPHALLGSWFYYRGELLQARAHLEQGLRLYVPQQHDPLAFRFGLDPGVECYVFLARSLWYLGYPEQARKWVNEALALAQERGHPSSLVMARHHAGTIFQLCREAAAAHTQAEAVVTLATEYGLSYWKACGMIVQGWASAMQGQGAVAVTQIRQALTDLRATGTIMTVPYFLGLLAEACGQVGCAETGLAVLAEALATVQQTGERGHEAELYRLQGELLLQTGVPRIEGNLALPVAHRQTPDAAAEACFHQAIMIARQQQARSLELRAALSLSRLWQQQDKGAAAHHLLAEVYHWFHEGFDTADLQEAKTLLHVLAD